MLQRRVLYCIIKFGINSFSKRHLQLFLSLYSLDGCRHTCYISDIFSCFGQQPCSDFQNKGHVWSVDASVRSAILYPWQPEEIFLLFKGFLSFPGREQCPEIVFVGHWQPLWLGAYPTPPSMNSQSHVCSQNQEMCSPIMFFHQHMCTFSLFQKSNTHGGSRASRHAHAKEWRYMELARKG